MGVHPSRIARVVHRSAMRARATALTVKARIFARVHGGGPKVFVVGRNKTGTTSLEVVLRAMGYRVGNQRHAELLFSDHYFHEDFGPILEYCRTAEAFQDVPFSARGMASVLDEAFPGSRFILTVRGSMEEWHSSLTKFHGRAFGTDGAPPTGAELRATTYRTPDFMANAVMKYYGTSDDNPYDFDVLTADYLAHNAEVRNHFATRPEQLLEIDVSRPDALSRLESFLGRSSGLAKMPHENRTGP